ncbi:hypothetical protein KI387_026807, partial [Taxus chinensis]
ELERQSLKIFPVPEQKENWGQKDGGDLVGTEPSKCPEISKEAKVLLDAAGLFFFLHTFEGHDESLSEEDAKTWNEGK